MGVAVFRFLDVVSPFDRNFFQVAFFTGMRLGEMAALKWQNVDFQRRLIKVVETRIYGQEHAPKTRKSIRDIKMLPPVERALLEQRRQTATGSRYVFLNTKECRFVPVR